jgi:CDP-glycerol glycerophosphotransferase (TagB/SpsB family)
MLEDPRILSILEEHDLRLIFYPHIELQKELDKFRSPSERIILASWKDYDVQDLLMRCSLLITDYSSVFFDAGYMEKPVIYYQFDMEDFRKYHYQEGYFSAEKHGFGPVASTEEALINAIYECAGNDFRMEEKYRDRLKAFFPVRDGKNCERVYEAVSRLSSGL